MLSASERAERKRLKPYRAFEKEREKRGYAQLLAQEAAEPRRKRKTARPGDIRVGEEAWYQESGGRVLHWTQRSWRRFVALPQYRHARAKLLKDGHFFFAEADDESGAPTGKKRRIRFGKRKKRKQ